MNETDGSLTPAERRLRGQMGAHKSWANTTDRTARTLPARLAHNAKFERQVDPDGKLSPAERAKRAESARKEYYTRLAYKSARARSRRGAMTRKGTTRPGGAA